jgi:hypothetical protein
LRFALRIRTTAIEVAIETRAMPMASGIRSNRSEGESLTTSRYAQLHFGGKN